LKASPPTLGEALSRFRQSNGLSAGEAAHATWSCRLGPATITLPNFAWRRKAIEAHDLHHVLTGYPCSMPGECQMASWEFGAGRMPHPAATLFCLPLVAAGLFWSPRKIFQAFVAGRRSHSFHGAVITEHLLATPLPEVHAQLAAALYQVQTGSDLARFGLLVTQSVFILLLPALLLFGLRVAFYAAFSG
jgi:hypothetical protein